MTDLVASGYPSAAARTNAEMKVVLDNFRHIFGEHLGGLPRSELTIASGAIVPPQGVGGCVHTVDTEGNAASDDLANITTTNTPDGRLLFLYASSTARVVTIKNAAGGAGQILLTGGVDFVYASLNSWVLLQRRSADWAEVTRFVPIADLTALTSLDTDDLLQAWDTSANTFKKITQANAVKTPAIEYLTSGTAATYTPLTGGKKILVEIWGPGGGSGGVAGVLAQAAISGAGGGGGYSRRLITGPVASCTYTVGVAGAAGASGNNAGAVGTATTFTDGTITLTANSGGAGAGMAATGGTNTGAGAAGGTASGGNVNYIGSDSGVKAVSGGILMCIPNGGGAPIIGGGVRGNVTGAGIVGRVPGEGGGCASTNDATSYAGAAGFRGEIRITTFY